MSDPSGNKDEVTMLRRRIRHQRAELRRLNRIFVAIWKGWDRGHSAEYQSNYRLKMMNAFGKEAVEAVERGDKYVAAGNFDFRIWPRDY